MDTAPYCGDPVFEFLGGWWSPCTACGRLAWDHEQADPITDVKNQIRAAAQGQPSSTYPPAMRKV